MAKFIGQPVEIEAEQFHVCGPDSLPFDPLPICKLGPDGWYVTTIMGQEVFIEEGDWIILEPNGRETHTAYPCKPDIFEAKYKPI